MKCPHCNADLVYSDWYGRLIHGEHYWIPNHWKKEGDIYKCPNSEGFESEEEAREYRKDFDGDWEDICCESFYNGGSFHIDLKGNFYEGTP